MHAAKSRAPEADYPASVADIPDAEVDLDPDLVGRLVTDQCPHLAEPGTLSAFAHGWDNEMFSWGDDLLVRLPRRAASAPLIEHEARWLPVVQDLVQVRLPVPLHVGRPALGYPWRWTVVPRLPGRCAAEFPAPRRSPAAADLARFFAGLHRPAPVDAPVNPYRGVPLSARADSFEPRIRRVAGVEAWHRWLRWASAPPWPGPSVWLHGDPHPLNLLLSDDGHLSGVVDWGDVTAGDPAGDLGMAWLVFTPEARRAFLRACDERGHYDAAVWQRARAWALGLASVFLANSDNQPALAAVGRHGLDQVLLEGD